MIDFQKNISSQGVTLLTSREPEFQSVHLAIYIPAGSLSDPLPGVAHFVEHQVFKGTEGRTAYDIVKDIEHCGGEINAYTSKEYTCYTVTILKEDLEKGLDVLLDLVQRASFDEEDFEKERNVILQEIYSIEDQPEELIFELFCKESFSSHKLGDPILGTEESLSQITNETIKDFYKKHYRPSQFIVSVVGDVEPQQVLKMIEEKVVSEEYTRHLNTKKELSLEQAPHRDIFNVWENRDTEQSYILFGFPCPGHKSKERFYSYLLSHILGGGMTSRLYQNVREEEGSVYSIYSVVESFYNVGIFYIFAATSEKNVSHVLNLIKDELDTLESEFIPEEELEVFKKQLKGEFLINFDDRESRREMLFMNEFRFQQQIPLEEILKEIDEINFESMKLYIQKYMNTQNQSLMILGNNNVAEQNASNIQ